MAFNVNGFMNAMSNDGARPNLFEVIFPYIDNSATGIGGNQFAFKARATSIPSSTLGVAPVNYFGRQVKLAGNRVFDNWTVTVLLDEPDYRAGPRYILEQWSNRINSHVANVRDPGFSFPLNYMQSALVNQYGKSGNLLATYDMIDCWPVDIGPVNLDWALDNQIAEFNVTFAMQWWQSAATS
jgi:T4-like virus tail tube protein gp19